MSDDLSKPNKSDRQLDDEDPTDQSPAPVFDKETAGGDEQKPGHEPTQATLTAIPGGFNKANASEETRETLRESNEMLSKQKEEILQLRDAIASMGSEIERLQQSITAQADAQIEAQAKQQAKANEPVEPVINPAPGSVNRLLVVISGGQRLKYPLFKDSMTIGRSPENDIQVNTEFVSRVHARITSSNSGARIEDLNSRNGVVVNSRKVGSKKLRNGDLIALGKIQFKFIDLMEDDSGEGRA